MSARRFTAHLPWVLLVALFPMLTFMGHWPTTLPIPHTNYYVSVPLAGAGHADEHTPEQAAEHARHCHGGVASCGDAPAGAGVSLSLYQDPVAVATVSLALIAVWLAAWQPRRPVAISPELMPPKASFHRLNIAL
ncbi:MAG: hypothetical protein AB7J35_16730 [Dehalococcoidia bacterium]